MAGSVNKVILVGNLGADPEIRRLNSGEPVVNIRIATSESWRDKNSGERKEKTEWHNVVIFNEGIAKVAEQYLKKGMKVYVEGQLQTRKWQDQTAPTSTRRKSCCRNSAVSCRCSTRAGRVKAAKSAAMPVAAAAVVPISASPARAKASIAVVAVPRAAAVAVRRANWTTKSRSDRNSRCCFWLKSNIAPRESIMDFRGFALSN